MLPKIRTTHQVTAIALQKATIAIVSVGMNPTEGNDTIDFSDEHPFVIRLLPGGRAVLVDSTLLDGANTYESIEFTIGLFTGPDSLLGADSLLKGKSIVLAGYLNGNPLDTFTFVSSLSMESQVLLDSALALSKGTSTAVVLVVKTAAWFADSLGAILDPRDEANRRSIETNIVESFSAYEDTDTIDFEQY